MMGGVKCTDMAQDNEDLEGRKLVWDAMQMVWMDTSVEDELEHIISVSAKSKYEVEELEGIFWNEVRPSVWTNMLNPIAGEWAGYDIDWLSKRILKRLEFGKVYRKSRLNPYSYFYWKKIESGVLQKRQITS